MKSRKIQKRNNRSLTLLCCLLMLLVKTTSAQDDKPVINFDVSHTNLGKVSSADVLLSLFTFTNTGNNNLYILRTEQNEKVQVVRPLRAIAPGDTGSLQVYFKPDRKGKFDERILVYTNASDKPAVLKLSGNIETLNNSPQECYSFIMDNGSQMSKPICKGTVINKETKLPISVARVFVSSSNQPVTSTTTLNGDFAIALNPGLYDFTATAEGYDTVVKAETYFNKNTGRLIFELTPRKAPVKDTGAVVIKEPPVKKDTVIIPPPGETGDPRNKPGQLSYDGFKPNNIIFLIDISSSMQGHDRLPLLKIAMESMIGQLRDIDRITIITYASKPRVLVPATSADYKEDLIKSIDTLRAAGSTSGSKGLDMAYAKAKESYINNANNQIILATDGAFDVTSRDKRLISKYASGFTKKITLSTVGFGTARTDLRQLEELSERGNGHYIYIANREAATSAILDEIKNNSKKD